MTEQKKTKQRALGQYMTTEEVALDMCRYFETDKDSWRVFDPTCGDGVLLEAAARVLLEHGVSINKIHLIGFDIDHEMIEKAKARLAKLQKNGSPNIELRHCDTLRVLAGELFNSDEPTLLENINIVVGNPPYGKNLEVRFFEECDRYFAGKAELVFLLPISFADAISDTKYTLLKGRPLGVTTGHVIVHHYCGSPFSRRKQKESLEQVDGFHVLTGVKLYAVGAGTPPQTSEILKSKPFSSTEYCSGWLPCLRTGDISKYKYTKGRLWVNYGVHLAHPKDLERFDGPRLFVRRVPIWADKSLGATFIEETALCAGDVLVIKHTTNDLELLRGLCVFLNSPEVSDYIVEQRPSVGHRDSFPKISAKDLARLFRQRLPSSDALRMLSNHFPQTNDTTT